MDCKKLEQYHDFVTIFVLLLAVQNGAHKDMLCLEVLFIPQTQGINNSYKGKRARIEQSV
jgi:hypothetical protein